MTPGFHTSSEFIEFEFIENKCSVFIFKGGDIYPLTTFCCNGFISVTANDGWRCNHFVSLILWWRKGSTITECWKSVFWLAGRTHYNTANQETVSPYKQGLTKLHFYEWVASCGFPLLFTLRGNLLQCEEDEKCSFWSDSGTCWWTCVRGSVHRDCLLQVRVGTPGSLDKLLTLQVHSSVPGSQDYSCHIYIYICTIG